MGALSFPAMVLQHTRYSCIAVWSLVRFHVSLWASVSKFLGCVHVDCVSSIRGGVSLGFFEDINVPVELLPSGSKFEPDLNNGGKLRWVWEYQDVPCDIYETDEIRFKIHSIDYPAIPVEQPKERDSKFLMEEQPRENINVKAFAPMLITATIDHDGLGPISWWEGGGDVEDEVEAEDEDEENS
ncbi:DNA-directed RNA polymerase III subunit RPC8 isoform X2 [Benincasa hispida]|uniref:DNA-directed RNA polymerase III subunit RPC8 isoform X2 n=1 Tax=Benincasa hispida TaxID=102211 RepID=UPI0018FF7CB5|nr:DNA-directed RNA polymerase III subunit RPC8 isoform X2 [Benincasa hispida]